jgi:type II secretory pathway pseudopilin PulG
MMRVRGQFVLGAFTIAEVIVVVIIIGLLGLIVVPRLLGMAGRQSEVEAQGVRSLLTAAAQRDAAGSRSLALGYDQSRRELRLLELQEKAGTPAWLPAPLVRPVRLGQIEVREALAQGQPQVPTANWRIELPQARARPTITLVLRTLQDAPGKAQAWQIDLLPGTLAAQLRPLAYDQPPQPAQTSAIDLDATGRRADPW